MKNYIVLSLLPLAVGCTQKTESIATTPAAHEIKSENKKASTSQQIMGLVQFQEKCESKNIDGSCLKITGGGDLSSQEDYYIPKNDKSSFNSVAQVAGDHQHVSLLAQVEKQGTEYVLQGVDAVSLVSK